MIFTPKKKTTFKLYKKLFIRHYKAFISLDNFHPNFVGRNINH